MLRPPAAAIYTDIDIHRKYAIHAISRPLCAALSASLQTQPLSSDSARAHAWAADTREVSRQPFAITVSIGSCSPPSPRCVRFSVYVYVYGVCVFACLRFCVFCFACLCFMSAVLQLEGHAARRSASIFGATSQCIHLWRSLFPAHGRAAPCRRTL